MQTKTAPKTIKIKITKQAINNLNKGKLPTNALSKCPVNRQLREMFGRDIRTMARCALIVINNKICQYDYPKSLINFVYNFDCRLPLKPGNFTIKLKK